MHHIRKSVLFSSLLIFLISITYSQRTSHAQTIENDLYLPIVVLGPAPDASSIGMSVTANPLATASLPERQSCLGIAVGQEFYVDLYVEKVRDLDEVRVRIGYNEDLVQVTAVNTDLFLAREPGANLLVAHDNFPDQDGTFAFTVRDSSTAAGESGSGTLARLTFETLTAGLSPITFEQSGSAATLAPALFNSDGQALGDNNADDQFDGPMRAVSVDVGGTCTERPDLLVVGFADDATAADQARITAAAGVRTADSAFADLNIYTVEIVSGQPLTVAQAALDQEPLVNWAEPVTRGSTTQGTLPNDPDLLSPRAHRWDLINVGQTISAQQGLIDADIDAHQAWNMLTDCTGTATASAPMVIAIIDSGLEVSNPDLAANAWSNPFNGTAADALPTVDDINGAAFSVPSSDAQVVISGDVTDLEGHGTAVASTVGAIGNNGRDLAGVCWSAQILTIKTDLYTASIARAMQYLLDLQGAGVDIRVVNASYGRDGFSFLERRMIQQLANADILFVTGAGNAGRPLNSPPKGIYRDNDNNNVVSNLDIRLTDVVTPGGGAPRFGATTTVSCPSNADCTNPLVAFAGLGRHTDPNSNSQYDAGEPFYVDLDGNDEVSHGDQRFSSVELSDVPFFQSQYPPGSSVRCFAGNPAASNPDCDRPLIAFNNNEKRVGGGNFGLFYGSYPCSYNLKNIICVGATDNKDEIWQSSSTGKGMVDLFAPGVDIRVLDAVGGAQAEIYRDVDGNSQVSASDIRLKPVQSGEGAYAAGSTVAANDNDVGSNLRTYAATVKHSENIVDNGIFDNRERIYHDNDNDNTVSVGDRRLNFELNGKQDVLTGHTDAGDPLIAFNNTEKHNSTRFISGTSFAAPNTAAMALLCWSLMPDRSSQQIKDLLLRFVDRKVAYAPYVGSSGRLRWPCSFELGDAPISYETIGSEGSSPELLLCGTSEDLGPIHLDPTNEHFGRGATQEHNAGTVGFLDQEGNSNLGPGDPGTCVSGLPDSDDKDDGGFTFEPPPPWIPNQPVKVSFQVCSPHIDIDGTEQLRGRRYGVGTVYATAWFDWNGDGEFTDEYTPLLPLDDITELNVLPPTLDPVLPATGGCVDVIRTFVPPAGSPPWMRWRLDYAEHKGANDPGTLFLPDPTRPMTNELNIAIYGEVEDYPFVYDPPRPPTKTAKPASVAPGESLHYAITFYGNPGLTTATAGNAIDELASSVEFGGNLTCTSGSCGYDATTHSITWDGDLSADTEVVMEYDVDIPLDYPQDWPPVENTVTVFDGVTTQSTSVSTPIECDDPGPIPPTKRATVNVIRPDAVYQYHINIPAKPNAPGSRRVLFTDPLPNLVHFEGNLDCQPRGVSCQYSEQSNSVQWSGDVGPTESVDVTFDVMVPRSIVPATCPAEIENRVTIFDPTGNVIIADRTALDCSE